MEYIMTGIAQPPSVPLASGEFSNTDDFSGRHAAPDTRGRRRSMLRELPASYKRAERSVTYQSIASRRPSPTRWVGW
jgi:hypothetical protein